jgi:putative glycosyltransferase
MELSIVTTLYHSASCLEEFYTRICATAQKITESFEIILVNDGSPDDSLALAVSLHLKDARVKVIDLSRNFGHHKAIMTGLAHACGELVFLLDVDLEEEPELLLLFGDELDRTCADVVYGVQSKRKGGLFERFTGHVFYGLFSLLCRIRLPRNVLTARLMRRRYVQSLIKHRDREVFLAGLWAITGYKQVPVAVTKHSTSRTTYGIGLRVATLVNAIVSFSTVPLVAVFYLGCVIVGLSGTAAVYVVARRLLFGAMLSGWPSLIVSIWLLGGLTIACLGLIGIYLSKVHAETKDRPYTIIREIYERKGSE